jgi:hypothetical protein
LLPVLQRTLTSWRQERLNGDNAFLPALKHCGEAAIPHMAPIQIAIETRNALMHTNETTS